MTPLLKEIQKRKTTLEIDRIAAHGSLRHRRPNWWQRFLKAGRRVA